MRKGRATPEEVKEKKRERGVDDKIEVERQDETIKSKLESPIPDKAKGLVISKLNSVPQTRARPLKAK